MKIGQRYNPYMMFDMAPIPNWLLCRTEISSGAKICFARLGQFKGKDGDCFASQETIAQEIGASLSQVKRYIKELKEHKLIEMERRGLTYTNKYYFIWHPWIEGKEIEHSDSSSMSYQEMSSMSYQEVTSMSDGRESLEENHREENHDTLPCIYTDFCQEAKISGEKESDSSQVKRKRKRKQKSNKSMKEAVKKKAEQKAPKSKRQNSLKYNNLQNNQLIELWNKQSNLRSHKNTSSKTYQEALRKLEMLRQGNLHKIINSQYLQNGIPKEYYTSKWKKADIAHAIKNLNEWCKEGNYPLKKDWIKKLSLPDAIFCKQYGSVLFQAYQKGVIPTYNPNKHLQNDEEKFAFQRLYEFFASNNGNYLGIKTQQQIVDLIKSVRGLRERHKNNWNSVDPEYFYCGFSPASTKMLILDLIDFLNGKFPTTDFQPNKNLTPNGLKVGGYVWKMFEKAFADRFHADVIEGPKM